jgi:GDP-4-dehydro-6-deoxy-D-mannose reductase
MNRYLITGASGFVSRHFIARIEADEPGAVLLGTDKAPPAFNYAHAFESLDLMDSAGVEWLVTEFRPTRIVHFASYSSVASSWVDPATSFANNTNIFLNILEAVRRNRIDCRILSIGSSEEYGNVNPGRVPLAETEPLDPISPYAVARVAQENLSRVYARSLGLDIVMTRSFNHVGPGQRTDFVIPSIVKQFLDCAADQVELSVGDISIVRDFLDVRDVVDAYLRILRDGKTAEVYNVCSGSGVSIGQVIDMVSAIVGKRYALHVDASRIRPNDNKIIVGDNRKLVEATAWKPRIALERSLSDIYDEMRG